MENFDYQQKSQTKIKLTQLLDTLFKDEQLERESHIKYVAYLLVHSQPEQYLSGLDLSFIEVDISTSQSPMLPEQLKLSRACKISDHPITWYINSVANIHNSYPKILTWNVMIIKVALYLLALPLIKPNLFKKEYSEHFNTIKRLFQRLRVANKSFLPTTSLRHTQNYQVFLNTHYPALSYQLAEFVEYLTLESRNLLDDFSKKMLNDIRIPFTYVLKNRPKPAKPISETKLYFSDWDTDGVIKHIIDQPTASKEQALNREQQLDEFDEQAIITNAEDISPVAKHSETAQRFVLSLIPKHMQRQDHALASSCMFPSVYSISDLLDMLHRDYTNQKNKSSLILLLCLITGVSYRSWIKFQNKKAQRLNERQKIIYRDGQAYLSTQFTIFENKNFKYPESLLNQVVYLDIPLPNVLIESIKLKPIITDKDLSKTIKILKKEVAIPQLSLLKTSSLLHHTILQKTGNKQIADIMTGVDSNYSSSISYCHHNVNKLQRNYVAILSELCSEFTQEYFDTVQYTNPNIYFGNQVAPVFHVVNRVFSFLQVKIYLEGENNLIAIFNAYSIWLWHLLLLFTAGRPVNDFPGFLKNISLDQSSLMISDKEIGGRRGFGRLIPLSKFIVDELKKYLQFLEHVQQQYKYSKHTLYDQIQCIFNSDRPLLNIIKNEELVSLTQSEVRDFYPELNLERPNWHRHVARAFLTDQEVPEALILALFAHEPMQQEAAHPYSSVSFNQYKQIASTLNTMQEHFKIMGIDLDAILT